MNAEEQNAEQQDTEVGPEYLDPAGARVIAFRDAVRGGADRLDTAEAVSLPAFYQEVRAGFDGLEPGDLADAEDTIRTQLEGFFRRMRALMEHHPDPVPASALDLPLDARFLRDMAEYLTRKYGLDDAL